MSTAKKTARVGNCSNTSHLLSRLAEVGEKEVAGLLNDLKQHAEQLEKKIRQLEKEAEKYKVSALQLCCGPIITAAHPDSSCSAALQGHDNGEAAAHEPKREAELGHLRNFMLARRYIMSTREDSADVLGAMVQCVNMGRWDVNSVSPYRCA